MKYKKIFKNLVGSDNLNVVKKTQFTNEFLYISAFPKSGSSFISLVLSHLLDTNFVDLIYSHYREQDLYEPKLQEYSDRNTISKHHTLATTPNIDLFLKYNIAPIILLRNLPDIVVSLREHISKTMRWPHFYVPDNFNKISIEEQHDLLIDIALPWYLFFYTSWTKVKDQKLMPVKFIQYEQFHQNQLNTFKEILDFWNLECSESKITESMEVIYNLSSDKNRINKGEMSRGSKILSKSQLERIVLLTKHYPDFNFNPILYLNN
ncbi:sulfotransferase domain-containing protein [Jejudonia soesokkakensis]|uniref:Sulfotransferase domain-containing protein n=1 Tax=Jejudonia soesokkakensis TaxID=1323432 RepID=A0ABW2MSJ7_9FLAO